MQPRASLVECRMGDDTDAWQGERPCPVWPVTVNGIFHSTINTEPKTLSPQILYPLLPSSKFKKLERLGQAGKLRGWERLESWEAATGLKKLAPLSITHLSQLMCTTTVSWPSRTVRQPSAAVMASSWHLETLMSSLRL